MFLCYLQFLSETFLVSKIIQRDIIINVKSPRVKYLWWWSVFNETGMFSAYFQKYQILSKLLIVSNENVWAAIGQSVLGLATGGRAGDRIPVEAGFSAPVQTGPGAHPAFYIMGTKLFSRG
jgi:hypothetical protein